MAERARASAPKKRKPKTANGKGHNSRAGLPGGGLPDEVKLRWLAKVNTAALAYDKAAEAAKKLKSQLSNVYAGAKDDGCNIDALKQARKLDRRDRLEVVDDYKATGDWLRLMDSPLVQLELFRTVDWPPENANQQGYRIGKAGGDVVTECPYDPGTEAFAAFRAGYDAGQQENQQSLREA